MNRYNVFIPLFLVISFPVDCERRHHARFVWDHWVHSGRFPNRIYNLMLGHYEDVARRVAEIRHIRFTYEESAQYEMGYIMGEIIERYRKMVENVKRPMQYLSDAVFDTLKRLQLTEMLYFEIYHLVNMMNEIPRKYGLTELTLTPKKKLEPSFDENQQAFNAQSQLLKEKERREQNKIKTLKEMKRIRELILKGEYKHNITRTPKNKLWPIDYGWEVDIIDDDVD